MIGVLPTPKKFWITPNCAAVSACHSSAPSLAQTVQPTLDPVRVDSIFIDHGRAARSAVVPIHVDVIGVVQELPELLARFGVQADQSFLIPHAIQLKEPPAADRADPVAFAQRPLPKDRQA